MRQEIKNYELKIKNKEIQKQVLKLFTILFMTGWSIIFISSRGNTGIPLEEGMTPQQAHAQIEKMKRQREEILREYQKERQKEEKEEEGLEKRDQLIKAMHPSTPVEIEEKPSAREKEVEEAGEEKAVPTPPSEGTGKGIVPGVITLEEESEKVKIAKQEKLDREYKFQRNFSFILMIIVMVVTMGLLIKSMSKGKIKKDEEKKKCIRDEYN